MKSPKLIIVPIDFSNDSINALEHAIYMANKIDGDVRMINVRKAKTQDIPSYFKDFNLVFGNTVEGYFEIIFEKYKDRVKGRFDYKVRDGKVYQEIINQAKYDDAYMIVMGTHGLSGFEEFWIGSNAYKVVSNAPCPVITIRNGFLRTGLSKIILPIDMSSESRKKVPVVADLALMFDAEIHTIAVRETNAQDIVDKLELYTTQVCEYFTNKKVRCHTESLYGDNITNITIEYAKGVDADLIAIMTEQDEDMYNLWLGAYAQQMVNHSPIPVLSVRAI
ncbi:MAG TPA: hypothetical protein DDX39_04525 [Bacteroidales bacterium]|nr:MAG: hypothetical protein A2W98_10475 [Bacteroidetes bacterium GWF2_33_38]OFY87081.1 MAG: hypothetical protein A2236_02830 [Bacteroidetes bacterium RIFOXYA2_FULL_33_7]HBF87889.1 hypothetical protein [Bacteroidales bacterium]